MNNLPMHLHAFLLIVILTGCGSERCPTLPGGVSYCLQSPASGPNFSALQQVVIGEGEQQETLLAHVENGPERLTLVGLTPLGQTVLTLTWDGKHIAVNKPPGMQPHINPAVLVAILQLAMWPQDAVHSGLPDSVVWKDDADGGHLLRRGESLLTIHRTGQTAPYETLSITMPPAKLILNIHTLPDDDCCAAGTAR